MTETGWQAIGRIAKERRERMGLNQEDLADFGGPKVSTVGKFERAAQERFPLRTQHQIERALGWERGTIEAYVTAHERGEDRDGYMGDWEHDLVAEDIPDLSQPIVDQARPDTFYRSRALGTISLKPRGNVQTPIRQQVEARFGGAVEFTEYVRRTFPDLAAESTDALLVLTHLYRAARYRLNDDKYLHEIAGPYLEKAGQDLQAALQLVLEDFENDRITHDGLRTLTEYLIDRMSFEEVDAVGAELRRDSAPDFLSEGADGNLTLLEVKGQPKAARTTRSQGRALRRRQDQAGEENQDVPTSYGSQVIDPSEQRQPASGPPRPDDTAD